MSLESDEMADFLQIPYKFSEQYVERVAIYEALGEPTRTFLGMLMVLEEADFSLPVHRALFASTKRLVDAGLYGGLAGMGPVFRDLYRQFPHEMAELTDDLESSSFMRPVETRDYEAWIRQLRALRRRREAATLAAECGQQIQTMSLQEVGPELSAVGQDLSKYAAELADLSVMAKAEDVFQESYVRACEPDERSGRRVHTGIRAIDQVTGGIDMSRYVVVGARPSVGKTAFAKTLILNALKDGLRVYMAVGEGTRFDIADGLIAMESGVSFSRINKRVLTDQEKARIAPAAGWFRGLPIELNDSVNLTPASIGARARALKQAEGLDLVVVDYLQKLTLPRAESREQQVAGASKFFSDLARELNCVVMVLCQLNRELAAREDKLPKMTDLRESGAIEQDADLILFLHRPAAIQQSGADPREAAFRIAKHRAGPIADGVMEFIPHLTRFVDKT